ncbi:hypothetical protein Tco_0255827 [Tanacetum coccineum]
MIPHRPIYPIPNTTRLHAITTGAPHHNLHRYHHLHHLSPFVFSGQGFGHPDNPPPTPPLLSTTTATHQHRHQHRTQTTTNPTSITPTPRHHLHSAVPSPRHILPPSSTIPTGACVWSRGYNRLGCFRCGFVVHQLKSHPNVTIPLPSDFGGVILLRLDENLHSSYKLKKKKKKGLP